MQVLAISVAIAQQVPPPLVPTGIAVHDQVKYTPSTPGAVPTHGPGHVPFAFAEKHLIRWLILLEQTPKAALDSPTNTNINTDKIVKINNFFIILLLYNKIHV